MKMAVQFTLNGRLYKVDVEPRKTLADVIRDDCGQTGTHLGCEHGVCGACTIIVNGQTIRSCLMFAFQAEGAVIETVESLSQGQNLHPLQQAFIDHHGLQCGFCTSGFLMLIIGSFRHKTQVSDDEIRDILSSNLCRCTGYENIVGAVRHWLADERKINV
jgi:aerobic carbon-monoxide dehydrogenase small subunit